MHENVLARVQKIAKGRLNDQQFSALMAIQEFEDERDWLDRSVDRVSGLFCPLRWMAYAEQFIDSQGVAPAECAAWEECTAINPTYTYFAFGRCNGAIKIGMSRAPKYRVSQLGYEKQNQPSDFLAMRQGGYHEKPYHRVFSQWHFGGEWFAPHPDILAEITRITGGQTDGE